MNNKPWWQSSTIQLLDSLIQSDWKVLEFGGGASSIWLAHRSKSVLTIEHSFKWISDIRQNALQDNLSNIKVEQWETPFHLQYDNLKTLNTDYDLIIVDGYEPRPQNCQAVYDNLKIGGLFVMDDSQRNNYQRVANDLNPYWECLNPEPSTDNDGKWTRVWKKTCEITEIWCPAKKPEDKSLYLTPLLNAWKINHKYY